MPTPMYWKSELTFSREGYTGKSGLNPLALSLTNWEPGKGSRWVGYQSNVCLILGPDVKGKDPRGTIRIQLLDPPAVPQHAPTPPAPKFRDTNDTRIVQVDYTRLNPLDILELATGYKDGNQWLDWVAQTAREQHMEGCVACASARPQLFTEPAPLYPSDHWGYSCMLALTREPSPPNCTTLASLFPPAPDRIRPGPFTPHKGGGNYTCFNFSGNSDVGRIPKDWCQVTFHDGTENSIIGHEMRSGLYYYCGGQKLHTQLPVKARGICALTRLGAP